MNCVFCYLLFCVFVLLFFIVIIIIVVVIIIIIHPVSLFPCQFTFALVFPCDVCVFMLDLSQCMPLFA